jgi:hypothetical protein
MSSLTPISRTERPVLRIMQTARHGDTYHVLLDYRGGQQFHAPIPTSFTFTLTPRSKSNCAGT